MGITVEVDVTYTADKRLYLNADRSQVVDESSADATFLLAGKGGAVTDADAKRYGLAGKKAAEAVVEEEAPEPATKAIPAPPENKAQTMRRKAEKDDD